MDAWVKSVFFFMFLLLFSIKRDLRYLFLTFDTLVAKLHVVWKQTNTYKTKLSNKNIKLLIVTRDLTPNTRLYTLCGVVTWRWISITPSSSTFAKVTSTRTRKLFPRVGWPTSRTVYCSSIMFLFIAFGYFGKMQGPRKTYSSSMLLLI